MWIRVLELRCHSTKKKALSQIETMDPTRTNLSPSSLGGWNRCISWPYSLVQTESQIFHGTDLFDLFRVLRHLSTFWTNPYFPWVLFVMALPSSQLQRPSFPSPYKTSFLPVSGTYLVDVCPPVPTLLNSVPRPGRPVPHQPQDKSIDVSDTWSQTPRRPGHPRERFLRRWWNDPGPLPNDHVLHTFLPQKLH